MAQTETVHTQVVQPGGEVHEPFPPFDSTMFPSQLLWFVVAFGFLYWYMAKRALPQIGLVIENRRARIARDLDDATAMQQRADAAAAAHEKTLADARAKARAMAQAAREQAVADADAKRRTLEDQLAARLAVAEREIAAMREQAMANVAQIAEETAGAIVERLAGRKPDKAAIASAIRSTEA